MKAQHTPGPWSHTQAFMSSWDIRRPDGTQMYFLGASTSIEKGEHEANARLIAAAPLLYESLREVLDDWENGLKPSETPSFQKALAAYQEAAE